MTAVFTIIKALAVAYLLISVVAAGQRLHEYADYERAIAGVPYGDIEFYQEPELLTPMVRKLPIAQWIILRHIKAVHSINGEGKEKVR